MSRVREYLEALLIALIFLHFASTFVVQNFYIPSGSMEETLLEGDRLLVNRFIFGPNESRWFPHREVQRGDIVIFRSPEDLELDMVKRCVGLPGDTVQVLGHRFFLNGEAVEDEAYAIHGAKNRHLSHNDALRLYQPRTDFGPVLVPEGQYFCMGDNRDNSRDSRYWGFLPRELVKGRAFLVYWSFDADYSAQAGPQSVSSKLGRSATNATRFFTRPRLDRVFTVVR